MDSGVARSGHARCWFVDVGALVLVAAAAVLGGAAQSVLGFGAAFTLVPALAVFAPDLLPGAAIAAFLPLTALMAYRERHHADRAAATRLAVARVPGTLVGTAAVALLPVRGLAATVAVLLLAAVLSTARGWTVTETARTTAAAGLISGFSGTAVGLGGPPLALLYRERHSSEVRPTLAVVFGVGTVLSIATLSATGGFHLEDLRAGLALGGLNVVGMVLAAPALRRVPEAVIRQGLLVWAFVGALLALVRVVSG